MPNDILQLADSVAKTYYEDDFYAHLSTLASVEFAINGSSSSKLKFDQRKYIALEQTAFEEAPKIEFEGTNDVDWKAIDHKIYAFQDRLESSLNGDSDDTRIKKVMDFSTKCYEKWITYQAMYPDSVSNPWLPTVRILRRGRLLYVSDSLNELKEFTRSISRSVDEQNQGNIGVVIKGKSSLLGGFIVDNRFEMQKIVYSFLKRESTNYANPLSLANIQDYLLGLGYDWPIDAIQIKITTPLKKSGFVGSTGKGFFIIQDLDDLVAAYCFHLTKVVSIRTILRQYDARSREFGDIDLEEECGGVTINQID